MKSDVIERWAADMLTVLVVNKEGAEHDLWVMLHHLFTAVKMFDQMDDPNKTIVENMVKKTKSMFESKFSLKKRKMKTKKKEKNTPTPLRERQEKEKEKETENSLSNKKGKNGKTLEQRREAFRQECLSYVGKYDPQQVADFFHYWAEDDEETGKMLFEMERTWKTSFRITRWIHNHFASDNTNSAIKLRNTKAREAEATAATQQLAAAAALREQENARREAEREESRRNAGGLTETMNANPNGILARIARERKARENLKIEKLKN